MSYSIEFFNPSVENEILDWPEGILASFVRITEQMVKSEPNLGMPYTKAFGKGLFEIRAQAFKGGVSWLI